MGATEQRRVTNVLKDMALDGAMAIASGKDPTQPAFQASVCAHSQINISSRLNVNVSSIQKE